LDLPCAAPPGALPCPALQEASERQLLDVDTYRRLNFGLMLQSLLMLVVLAQGYSVRSSRLLGEGYG
jgi:hypothetical protein